MPDLERGRSLARSLLLLQMEVTFSMRDHWPCPSCGTHMLRVDAMRGKEVLQTLMQCPHGHVWLERRDDRGAKIVVAVS